MRPRVRKGARGHRSKQRETSELVERLVMRRRKRRRNCANLKGLHALCYHHCRIFSEDPYPWLCGGPAAKNTSALEGDFEALATIVRRHGSAEDAISRRLQSIAAWLPQTEYYSKVVRRPGISTVCEVGFVRRAVTRLQLA